MASSTPTRVSNLVAHHTAEIERVSPQTSPVQARPAPLPAMDAPTSPTPQAAAALDGQDAAIGSRTQDAQTAGAPPAAAAAAAAGGADASMASSGTLEDIAEGAETDSGAGNGSDKKSSSAATAAPATDPEAAAAAAGAEEEQPASKGEEPSEPVVAEGVEVPMHKLQEGVDTMPPHQQEVVRANLTRVADYPSELPLSASWTLFFSDTSGAAKSNSAAATKEAYHEGINPIFTAATVPELCGQYKAFKQAPKSKRAKAGDPETLGLTRPGMNLHFFRAGINPTWEDPYNEKGGRITLSPSAALFDTIYERLVFLLAGAALELGTSDLLHTEGPAPGSKRPPTPGPPQEGQINGVVASRRARGDRIEIWLGGRKKKEPVPGEWLDRFKEVLASELDMPELRSSKYKKHF